MPSFSLASSCWASTADSIKPTREGNFLKASPDGRPYVRRYRNWSSLRRGTHGHAAGDKLLALVGKLLNECVRTSDYAFRIGGDEFALLLVHSDSEQANTLARRIRANFATAVQNMQASVGLGLDYGIAVFPEDGDQKEVLVRIADQRLYEMKHVERKVQKPIPQQAPPPPIKASPQPVADPAPSPNPTPSASAATAPGRSETRKWERVSLVGTRAYAQLADDPQRTARVIDLGYGGLALEIESSVEIGSRFSAVLHVPILPPVRVLLKKLYQVPGNGGQMRVGCAFVS